MPSRTADVFFYGLFMDQQLLVDKGLRPQAAEIASVEGFALRIGHRAAIVPAPGDRVYGVVVSLTLEEIDRLYSEPSVRAYEPQAVLVHLSDGAAIAALCYNLPQPPSPDEHDPDYASRLRAVAEKTGLPAEYVASIR